jgi:hypothetical protein
LRGVVESDDVKVTPQSTADNDNDDGDDAVAVVADCRDESKRIDDSAQQAAVLLAPDQMTKWRDVDSAGRDINRTS